ncbi:PTS lactose/cellobiose transporter subunit IIA [Vibrio hippocampi]|uniref:PTS system N,N'-diacetylchitobiose-specific EIIA component n=1 Tax=Vibrio hippocampi TaxID=654686 RepID=A0ABM8ZNI5_9VIBR|nr:PTS lactose/cellobiose transporter subunit IIA [Vibrio hippocampi]CAH0530060.1 PTS system N,N'-diacetylchitobiose-specific EIIA component [Vibrio hippocampi]
MSHTILSNDDINEEFLMSLLCLVGESRSLIMQSILLARQNQYQQAVETLQQGEGYLEQVHQKQTSLIAFDEGEGKVQMTLILTHIQDHIMTTMLCKDLAKELIEIHKKIDGDV